MVTTSVLATKITMITKSFCHDEHDDHEAVRAPNPN